MSKLIKYSLLIVATLLLIWFSLDIQNLETYKAKQKPVSFNATNYAENFWNESLPVCIENSVDIGRLFQEMDEVPEYAFEKYGRKLGISSTYYFMLKGTGTIESVEEDFVVLAINDETKVRILSDFIYGNAVREGSGKVDINDFMNMTDFNKVSVAINKLIKEKVALRLKSIAKVGQELEFAGAVELNEGNLNLNEISIIPVSVKIANGKSE